MNINRLDENLTIPVDTRGTLPYRAPGNKKRGKRASVRYLKGGRLKYKEIEYVLPKNSYHSILSQNIYAVCRTVGSSVSVEKLYRATGRDENIDPIGNWKFLSDTVRSANRWAKGKGLPTLFKCTIKEVIRLGTDDTKGIWN